MISSAQKGSMYAKLGEHLISYIDRMNDLDEVDTAERILEAFLPGANKILNDGFSQVPMGDVIDEIEARGDGTELDTVVFVAKDMHGTKHPRLVIRSTPTNGALLSFSADELRELADHLNGL